ncbi:hypothetical protein CSHISOI_02835 [Colletotrichum shisoi]|uniref:alpha-L-rhamnosidase n=1 Tax=Colletotrichum shisoi TaxID=2078593 RepID=A0A5Q4BZX2_9PEZI|nr:hypothetical protein CSHISOI_02835 [Colletotrichum shisoi]
MELFTILSTTRRVKDSRRPHQRVEYEVLEISTAKAVSISQVTFEHLRLTFGIAESEPRISWRFDGNAVDWEQSAYDVEISRGTDGSSNIQKFNSSTSLAVPWPEQALQTAEQATVRARAHGKPSQPSTPWSDWVTVETGLFDSSDWAGTVPIAADRETEVDGPKRPIYFRKSFPGGANVTRARLYITALGIYEAEINGRRTHTTSRNSSPDTSGENAIGVAVGRSWFSGRLSYNGGVRNNCGDTIGLLSLLVVTFDDGSVVKVPTDPTCQANTGPVVSSEIYNDEHYDSTLEAAVEGWSSAAFEASNWLSVKELPALNGELVAPDGPPVKRIEERKPESIFESPPGKTIIDFGQNLVGWLRLTVSGPSGTNITLHHAEVLEDGELALRPLRVATAADSLILYGNGNQIWEPRFTFRGFRYAQIDGWPQETPLTAESGHRSGCPQRHGTDWLARMLEFPAQQFNKFHQNVRWSMKGNFLIPTGCPQRDERLGWTGDAHAFAPTANYLYDAAGFWKGWHKDTWSEMQRIDSMYGGDVAVANPFNIYQAFGDVALLEEQYLQSHAWINTGISHNEVGLRNRSSFQFADWLNPTASAEEPGNAPTAKHLVADPYLIHMTEFRAIMSASLGGDEAAAKYRAQRDNLTAAFHDAWVQDAALANETQTAYAMALNFGLFGFHLNVEIPPNTKADITLPNGGETQEVGSGYHEFHDPSYQLA